MAEYIDRQAAIDASEKFIKDCNPDHFVGHQKFIEYMDNAEIGSFGKWQFANGFNMGLTATEVAIKKLPSAQPERKKGKWIWKTGDVYKCSECETETHVDECFEEPIYNYCPYCNAVMDGYKR